MARTTATIFGLALAAVSIAFNATRYPIVFQAAETAAAKTSDATDPPADQPDAVPQESNVIVKDGQPVEEAPPMVEHEPLLAAEMPPPEARPTSPSAIEAPLVPVHFAGLSRGGQNGPVPRKEVRRLPPVDRNEAAPIGPGPANGPIPVYPSTGIERESIHSSGEGQTAQGT
ncbi:MAG: hypothetical protein JW959_10845 [Pirellulales bacterium]|nr:hypothetical protein [Pirellulales bacterium]